MSFGRSSSLPRSRRTSAARSRVPLVAVAPRNDLIFTHGESVARKYEAQEDGERDRDEHFAINIERADEEAAASTTASMRSLPDRQSRSWRWQTSAIVHSKSMRIQDDGRG